MLVLVCIFDKNKNVFYIARKDLAQVVDRNSAYGLIVFQPIQQTSAYAILLDEFIGGKSF